MSSTMKAPFYPIIYVRGYAGSESAVEETVATPFMGFNLGETEDTDATTDSSAALARWRSVSSVPTGWGPDSAESSCTITRRSPWGGSSTVTGEATGSRSASIYWRVSSRIWDCQPMPGQGPGWLT